MKSIIVERPEGVMLVGLASPDGEPEADYIARMTSSHTIGALRHVVVDAASLPDLPPERWQIDWSTGIINVLPVPIAALKETRIAEAWASMQARVMASSVSVATSAGIHQYGLDPVTQDNLQKALLAVFLGITPNPRPWTPKGAATPILITHDDVRTIAGSVGLAYDGYMQAYLAHKRGIMAADTADAVAACDLTQGWPA